MEKSHNYECQPESLDYIKDMCNSDLLVYAEFLYICNHDMYERVKYFIEDEIIRRGIDLDKE